MYECQDERSPWFVQYDSHSVFTFSHFLFFLFWQLLRADAFPVVLCYLLLLIDYVTPTSADGLSSEHSVTVRTFRVWSSLCEKNAGLMARSHLGIWLGGGCDLLLALLLANGKWPVFRPESVNRDGGFSLLTPNAVVWTQLITCELAGGAFLTIWRGVT